MSVPYFNFTGGALKLAGARKMVFEVDTTVLKAKIAPSPASDAVIVSKVEPPAEVSQAAPETGLVPKNPPAK
jgi:hypothetical protein